MQAGVEPVADLELDVVLDLGPEKGYSVSPRQELDALDEDFSAQFRFTRAVLADTHPWARSANGSDAEAQDPGEGNLWLFLYFDAEFTSSLEGWTATKVDSTWKVNDDETGGFWYAGSRGTSSQMSIRVPEDMRTFTVNASMLSDGSAGEVHTRSDLGPEEFTVTFPDR